MISRLLFNRKLWIIMTFFNFSACNSEPTLVPFSAEKAGSVTSQTLHVTRETGWEAHLVFLTPKGGLDTVAFDQLELVVNGISGGPSTPRKPHHGIRLHLTITQKTNSQPPLLIHEKLIEEEPLSGGAPGGPSVHLDGFRLGPGEYEVSIETLDNDPRLVGIKVALFVGTTWK